MNKLTEENICLHFMPLVISECRNAYKGLELEDRIAEGEHALIYAIRTYRVSYGCFSDYLVAQLQRVLKQKNSEAWILKKLEAQLSLDALSPKERRILNLRYADYSIENISYILKIPLSKVYETMDELKYKFMYYFR